MIAEITPLPSEFDRYYTLEHLDLSVREAPMRHFPVLEGRWHIPVEEWEEMVPPDAATGVIEVPDGSWNVSRYPNRGASAPEGTVLDPAIITKHNNPIAPERLAAWRESGLVDQYGLPIHPWAKRGVTTVLPDGTKVGMATGIGREWYYGEIATAALGLARCNGSGEIEYAYVETRDKDRAGNDKRRLSLPGGHVNRGESVRQAYKRETNEETGLVDICEAADIPWEVIEAQPNVAWKMTPSITGPCTLNAWLGEHFVMIDATDITELQHLTLATRDPNEVKSLGWRHWRELLAEPIFMGAHKWAIRAHIQLMGGGSSKEVS